MEPKKNHALSPWLLLWLLVFAAGGALLFVGNNHEALWYDEAYTMAVSSWDAPDIVNLISKDSHPPLYFLMLRDFTLVFGNTTQAARAYSAIGVLLLAGLGLFPLRRWWGDWRALVFSVLCLSLPVLAFMGQEARMYTWAAFWVCAAFLSAEAIHRKMSSGSKAGILTWIALGLTSLAAAWTHYYALIAAVWIWFMLFIHLFTARKSIKSREFVLPALVTGVLCVLLYLPWLQAVLVQSGRVARNYWIGPLNPGSVFSIIMNPWNPSNFNFASVFSGPLSWGLIIGFPVTAGIRHLVKGFKKNPGTIAPENVSTDPAPARTQTAPEPALALRALLVFVLTLASGIVVSLLFRPVLIERYLVPCAGLLVLALAAAVTSLPRKTLVAAALAALCALNSLPLVDMHTKRYKGAMTEAVADLKGKIGLDDVFVHPTELNLGPFAWYFPANKHYLWVPADFIPFSNYDVFGHNSRWGNDPAAWIASPERIWMTWLSWEKPDFPSIPWLSGYELEDAREYRVDDSWYAPVVGLFVKKSPGN